MIIWAVIVEPNFKALSRPFLVEVESFEIIYHVKIKAKEAENNILGPLNSSQFTVWKIEGKVDLDDLEETLKSISNAPSSNTIKKVSEDKVVGTLGFTDGQILLIQIDHRVPRGTTISDGISEVEDKVPEMSKIFGRYNDTLANSGLSPSMASQSTMYRANQGKITQVIYDGRRGSDKATIGPPIQIFHPIFDDFTHMVNDPGVQPTVDDLANVYELMYHAGEIQPDIDYRERVRLLLGRILDTQISMGPISKTGCMPDGIVTLDVCNDILPYMILEVKREMGEGGCDPTTQVGLHMRRSWINDSKRRAREVLRPNVLGHYWGPVVVCSGWRIHRQGYRPRLTDMRWIALSSVQEDNRIYHNARVLIALRNCLKTLREYYENLKHSKLIHIVPGKPHPRFFPYTPSFTDRTQKTEVHFRYLGFMQDDPACVTYRAEITDKDGTATGDRVVVKFVASYGEEVHDFLAQVGMAPTLRYCGPFYQKTGLSDDLPRPAQRAPPGLFLRSNMRMVVMDFIDALPWDQNPQDAREQIREVLTVLHTNGYVFGDLRQPNILFDKDKKVKLIDFDWSGRFNTEDSENLVDGPQEQILGNMDRAEVGGRSYAHYPLGMSTDQDMWVDGMEPLTPIRPKHDRGMLDMLHFQ